MATTVTFVCDECGKKQKASKTRWRNQITVNSWDWPPTFGGKSLNIEVCSVECLKAMVKKMPFPMPEIDDLPK